MSRVVGNRRKDTLHMTFVQMFQHDMDQGDADLLYGIRHGWQEKLFDLTADEMIQILIYQHHRSLNLDTLCKKNGHLHNDRKKVEWDMFYFLLNTCLEFQICWPNLLGRLEIRNGHEYCQFRFPRSISFVIAHSRLSDDSKSELKRIHHIQRHDSS